MKLVPIRGNAHVVELTSGVVTIGRHPACTIPLADEKASRNHCEIVRDEHGRYVVRDLGSRNGTRLNDVKVRQSILNAGDVLRVGDHEFLCDAPIEAAPLEPAPVPAEEPGHDEPVSENLSHASASARSGTAMGTRENSDWSGEVSALIEALPPKLQQHESVSMIDAAGKPTEALTGPSDGASAVRLLLRCASKARATDIHFEPRPGQCRVRMRVDGQMVDIVELPARVGELTYGLVKTACLMPLAARDAVQEGHFSAGFADRRVDYRVSFTPSVHGQKLVVRVLDSRSVPTSLAELGLAPYMNERVRRVCEQDHGLLLVCGPTGSGKTTTLYNALREIDRQSRNVVTIEDPVEYQLDGVTQIPIDSGKGNTFGQLLRSVLRQDPDVILVGEIRDEETARTAMQAAMTGHVVFSSVHAKDTIAAVFRLLDLKVEPYLVANSLDLVLAQRLVRVLCPACKRDAPVTASQASRMGRYIEGKRSMSIATGCQKCLKTGFRGRRAIFELLDFNDELRDVVLREPTIAAMKRVIEQGMFTTLTQFGYRLVAEGSTTLEEIDRVGM